MGNIIDSVKNTKELITYFYHNDVNIGFPNIKQGFTVINEKYSSYNMIPISDINNTKFKSIDKSDSSKIYRYTNQTESSNIKDYIEFELSYGEEFYCYLKDEEGYEGGSLSKYYGIALDKDINIDATDAIPIKLFLSIEPKRHTNINVIYNGEVINRNSSSVEIPYGAYIKVTVTSDIGYKDSSIILDGYDTERREVEFNMNEDTFITAKEVASNDVSLSVTSPKNTTVKFTADNGKYKLVVPPEFTKLIKSIPLYTKYLIIISTTPGLRPGKSSIPLYGILRPSMVDNNDVINVTVSEPRTISYDIDILQNDPNQTINVLNATTYTNYSSSFKANAKDKLIVTVNAKKGYTAGRPSVSECVVDQDMTITAYPSVEKEFTLFVDCPDHLTFRIILQNRLIEVSPKESKSFIHIKYGSMYHIDITPDYGYNYPELPDDLLNNMIGVDTNIMKHDLQKNEIHVNLSKPSSKPIYVEIKQSYHQRITVEYNNTLYTESFIANYGDKIKASVVSTEDFYTAGTVNIGNNEYTLTKDITIYATYPVRAQFDVVIIQSPNQVISVKYNNINYTKSFKVYPHDSISASIESDNDLYSPGLLSLKEAKNITNAVVVSATPAVKAGMYTVRYTSIPGVKISVMHNGVLAPSNTFIASYGDTYYIQVDNVKHINGSINYPHSGIIIENMDIMFNRKE